MTSRKKSAAAESPVLKKTLKHLAARKAFDGAVETAAAELKLKADTYGRLQRDATSEAALLNKDIWQQLFRAEIDVLSAALKYSEAVEASKKFLESFNPAE